MIERDVEDLVRWAYQDQKADQVMSRLLPIEALLDGVKYQAVSLGLHAIARDGALGCTVDSSPILAGAGSVDTVHPDAESIDQHVRELGDDGVLLAMFGRTGLRPDWWPNAKTRVVARTDTLGRRRRNGRNHDVIYTDQKQCRYGYCPVTVIDAPESITHHRAIYSAWHIGLLLLRKRLARPGVLTKYIPIGPSAPAVPWANNGVDCEDKI